MGRYPLVLSRIAIRRIIDRKAALLILARNVPPGRIEIHDGYIVKKNERERRRGRSDLLEDPLVMTIEIDSVDARCCADLDVVTLHKAGFRATTEDEFPTALDAFRADWRRRPLGPETEIHVHTFHLVDDVRFLHARVHRGYTTDPSRAAFGEPEALSDHDLELVVRRRRARDEEFNRAAKRSIGLRAREAARTGDLEAWSRLGSELAAITSEEETSAAFLSQITAPQRLLAGTAEAR